MAMRIDASVLCHQSPNGVGEHPVVTRVRAFDENDFTFDLRLSYFGNAITGPRPSLEM